MRLRFGQGSDARARVHHPGRPAGSRRVGTLERGAGRAGSSFRVPDPEARGHARKTANAGRGRERLNRCRLVVEAHVCVDAQREPYVAVPCQRLGHLGGQVGPFQAGDEQVSVGIKICEQAVAIAPLPRIVLFVAMKKRSLLRRQGSSTGKVQPVCTTPTTGTDVPGLTVVLTQTTCQQAART